MHFIVSNEFVYCVIKQFQELSDYRLKKSDKM